MTKLLITHKRGDTFQWAVTHPVDDDVPTLEGWTVFSQVRTQTGKHVATLVESNRDNAARRFVLTAADTTAWPVGALQCDIQYTDPLGVIRSTPTIEIDCVRDVAFLA